MMIGSEIISYVLDRPTKPINDCVVEEVKKWEARHLEYIKSLDESTPKRVQSQIDNNLAMQVKALGLITIVSNVTGIGQILINDKPSIREGMYLSIANVCEKALKHLLSIPVLTKVETNDKNH